MRGVNECVITLMFDSVLISRRLEFVSLTSYSGSDPGFPKKRGLNVEID